MMASQTPLLERPGGKAMRIEGVVRLMSIVLTIIATGMICAPSPAAAQARFSAGFGKADITPAEPVFMGGYAMRGTASIGLHGQDQLFAWALAFSDGTTKVVFVE